MSSIPSAEHLGSLLSAISSKNPYHAELLATAPMTSACYVSAYAAAGKAPSYFWKVEPPLAANLAGDLLLMPSTRILENITAGSLEDTLLEAYLEVSNMLGTALNGPGKERLILSTIVLDTNGLNSGTDIASFAVRAGVAGPWRVNLASA